MTDISPAANAVWEAFNQDEAGVFVDYGDKLAAALRAAVDQVVPEQLPMLDHAGLRQNRLRHELLAIADELEALPND